jgi:hypothetical protein
MPDAIVRAIVDTLKQSARYLRWNRDTFMDDEGDQMAYRIILNAAQRVEKGE